MRRSSGLRLKLALGGVALLGLLWGISTYNTAKIVDQSLRSQLEERGKLLSPMLNSALAVPMVQRDYASVGAILLESRASPELEYIFVQDSQGTVIASEGKAPPEVMNGTPTSNSDDPITLQTQHFSTPLALAGQAVGVVRFGLSGSSLLATRQAMLRDMFLIGTLALVLVSLILWIASGSIIRPLSRLARSSRQIESGHYDLDLPQAGNDEIGDLIKAFRAMGIEINRKVSELTASQGLQQTYLREALQRQEELKIAVRAAQAANEAKSQFLANMSHEIRTPLNAMMGMLQLLRKTGLSDKQLDFATKSHSAALFLQRLLNDILDFSKIEANMLVFDAQPFALKDLMQEVSHVLQPPASDKGLALKVDTEALAGRVIGDEHRLRQVLLNLGSNAIKFTPSGSVHIKAEVISQGDHAVELLFSVRDTGIGIAAEQRANIFKSFTQAEASTTRRFGGSGLGLSISNGLVKLMGSHIRLQSQPGQGSTFSFRINLPLADEASQDAAQQVSQDTPAAQPSALGAVATEHHHPSAELASAAASSAPVPASKATASTPLTSAKPLKGLRVLVVEDSPMNQEVAKGLLEDEGAQVEVAENGQTGLDAVIAANPPFDAVLMDIQMPVMDGFVSTMAIRRIPQFQDLPIIAMTANAMASDRDKCFAIGMNGYIGKPYDIAEVVATLLRATAKHREQKAQGSPSKPGAGGSGLSWADAAVSESTLAVGAAHNIELPLALKRMGGKIGIYKRMLHSFSQDIGGIAGQLRALSPDSPESAMRLLHSFKGSAGMLGFRALSERLAQAERDLKQSARPSLEPEEINALSALIDTEQKAAAALLSALDDDLAQQKAHQAQSRSTLTPSELEAFSADMHRLIALLEASNMSAVDLFEQIHAQYPQMLGAAASSLQKAIDTLAFKNAAELCEDLLLSST